MAAMTQDCSDARELIGLLTRQRDLYVRLGELSRSQRTLITADEPERLLDVLAQRQECIGAIETLARRLRAYQQNWRTVRLGLSEEDGCCVDRLVGQVNTLLAGILQQDAADAELLAVRKESVSQAISSVRTVRHAGAAYAASNDAGAPRGEWVVE
ncbi:MAG: hypothetical protein AMXMBFR13_37080 [Phycisphaerae bacterium]